MRNVYTPTIGLEIHAELNTKTKMFCQCKNDPEQKDPNVNICPVCMAHPGTLPVINKKAVKHVLKVGKAIGAHLAMDFTEFDRKNYFYPDIPKGYQISQYKYPLVAGGCIVGVEVTRIHLEEDTARSQHNNGNHSLVDYNRAGLPLMELVTEPVIKDAETAGRFARELQLLLRYLGASEANMEKGQMRVEANISVSKTDEFGTKVEVKNLNSFKSVEKAIEYEIKRHIEVIESGGEIIQETRGWDELKQETFSQRKKENSDDYRYFPDPDLPKLVLKELKDFDEKLLEGELPELPWEKRARYKEKYKLKDEDVEMYVQAREYGDFLDDVAKELKEDEDLLRIASNYITSDLAGMFKNGNMPDFSKLTFKDFSSLIKMVSGGDISSRGAKDILKIMVETGDNPQKIAEEKDMLQKSDEGELKKIVDDILSEHASVVEDYKSGKESALQFLVGQGMKATKGSANPQVLKKLLQEVMK